MTIRPAGPPPPPQLYMAGEIELNPDIVTPATIRDIATAASKLDVEDGPTKGEWKKLAERVIESGNLESDDVKMVNDFAKKVRTLHRELHREFRDSDYSDKKVNNKLEDVHVFLQTFEAPYRHYMEQAAKASLQALSGANFGPIGAVAAYVMHSGLGAAGAKELVGHLEGLQTPDSPLVFPGNSVQPVHQEKLWQAKIRMLDEALENALAGKPVEVDVQYFELTSDEIVGRLASLAEAGCPVRVNMDPSRLQAGGLAGNSVDDAPRKLRALFQLAQVDGDVGLSIYPVAYMLGGMSELMHRKLVRTGDEVLLGGCNANKGSGENVDAGYLIHGPAARALVEDYARDLHDSVGSKVQDIYGEAQIEKFLEQPLTLTVRGLAALMDIYSGPAPAGTPLPEFKTGAEIMDFAKEAGFNLGRMLDIPKDELEATLDSAVKNRSAMTLSKAGAKVMTTAVKNAVKLTLKPENQERLERVELPSGEAAGSVRVGVGDQPSEREALLLHAIASAEKFVYIPTFVITKAIAAALAARRDELAREGKEIDIRVIADPGIYPHGGTPNEFGVLELEDQGIPVRWALLPRTNKDHDRKIHAKQVVTDKNEFFGSTNLSKKGMRDNWEVSGLIFFDQGNPQAESAREDGKSRFLKLWEHESFELNTKDVAERRLAGVETKDREMRVREARAGVVRGILSNILRFEQQSADWVQELARKDRGVAERALELEKEGLAPGYALLRAAEEVLGTERFYTELGELPARQKLERLKTVDDVDEIHHEQ